MDSVGHRRSPATWRMRQRGPGSLPCRGEVSGRVCVARARLRAGVCGVAILIAATGLLGCGSSPTAADPGGLPLVQGRQLLTLSGFAVSSDPALPPCAPIGQPRDGTSVNTVVVLTPENGGWVARSALDLGTIELRLRAGANAAAGYPVSGTISGTGIDIGLMGVTRDVRVTFASATGGAATFEGETTSKSSPMVVGRMSGAMRFADSQGVSSTCAAIQWTMQPY